MALTATNTAFSPEQDVAATIAQLAREASIEINVHDIGHLEEGRRLLPAGKAVYVSHLPKQEWRETEETCRAVRAAGFRPVPHVPVRLLPDAATVDRVFGGFVETESRRGAVDLRRLPTGERSLRRSFAADEFWCIATTRPEAGVRGGPSRGASQGATCGHPACRTR
jgi:hypothetical protein